MATSPIIRADPSGTPYTYIPVNLDNRPVKKSPLIYASTMPAESEQGQRPRWKPFTLRTPSILFFFLATISFIVIIEVLLQKSQRNNGLIHTRRLDNLTAWESFCYRYLLTIISVLYGMVWASVDLDIKRLEPFFQLSGAKGATAANSLLLHYPFDFLASVPITALARRHWSVCCSGFALILIFWVITPMQSALLASTTVQRNITDQFTTYMEPLTFERQANEISVQYMYTTYSNIYLGEELPSFLTKEYVAVPFKPLDSTSSSRDKETKEYWTATTRVYSSSIECLPTTQTFMNGTYDSYNISSNVDCSAVRRLTMGAGLREPGGRGLEINGFGYDGQGSTYYLSPQWCYNKSYFLLMWTQRLNLLVKPNSTNLPPFDFTAIFCKPKYFYSDTNITVDAKTLQVIAKDPGELISFTQEDKIFDLNRFERDWSLAKAPRVQGWIDSSPPNKDVLEHWNLTNSYAMIGYVAGLSEDVPFLSLKDPKVLAEVFQRGHRMLFANFARATFQDIEDSGRTLEGYRTVVSLAIVVVEVFARLLEGFLAVVAICFAILGVLNFRRNANLFSDPDSLAAEMALVADSKGLLRDFDGLDESPKLKNELLHRVYRLDKWDSNGYYRIDLEETLEYQPIHSISPKIESERPAIKVVARPLVLRTSMGVSLVVSLILLLGFVVYLYNFAQKHNGLPTLSKNQVVVQIIFSFIPTALATGMEPFWVLITRYFCIYQPYIQLAKGKASPSISLSTKYTNVPPALVFFRAFRAKHYILFSLSATALLCNVLAVALSSLFDKEIRSTNVSQDFLQLTSPQINLNYVVDTNNPLISGSNSAKSQLDNQFSLIYSNISQNTPLPSWTSKDYYFLPFEWASAPINDDDFYKATTRGFGISMDCQPLESLVLEATVYLTESKLNVNITLPIDNTRRVRCAADLRSALDFNFINGVTGQNVAGEFKLSLVPTDMSEQPDLDALETCGTAVILGWNRAVVNDISPRSLQGFLGSINLDTYKNVTLVCHQKINTAMFEVVVDTDSRIRHYTRVGPFDDPLQFFQHNTTLRNFNALYYKTNYAGSFVSFHNDTTPSDYFTYIMDQLMNLNTSDPNAPLPDAATIIEGLTETLARYFALNLASNSENIFMGETTARNIDGFKIIDVERITMSRIMFYIIIAILGLDAIVASIAYMFRPKNFLPRFPDSLASEIAYFHASHALKDVSGTVAMGSAKRDKHLNRLGHTYGFGEFIGTDGKRHRGVERSSIIESYRE